MPFIPGSPEAAVASVLRGMNEPLPDNYSVRRPWQEYRSGFEGTTLPPVNNFCDVDTAWRPLAPDVSPQVSFPEVARFQPYEPPTPPAYAELYKPKEPPRADEFDGYVGNLLERMQKLNRVRYADDD